MRYDITVEPGDIIVGVAASAVLVCLVERVSGYEASGRRMLTGGRWSLDRKSSLLSWTLGDSEMKDVPVIIPELPPAIDLTLRSLDNRLRAGGNALLSEDEKVALMFVSSIRQRLRPHGG
ncbi:hypothetical protein [Bosea sp. OK403]|uniref:hypothetical protein n=1 Tax=Bosea sp. OK403 TaxID=1855286 RepID=UPI000B8676B5|nr:hypothetical protein [Bosea sp. OK403]